MRNAMTELWAARPGSGQPGILRVLACGFLAAAWMGTGCTDVLGIEIGVPVPVCGDGVLDLSAGEACDDGGDSPTCDRDCTPVVCGDLLFNPAAGEECDEGMDSETCTRYCTLPRCGDGYVDSEAGETCDDRGESATCDRDCSEPACGDAIANVLTGEACDDGDSDASDACTTSCQWARCGDGLTHIGVEACDDGNVDETDSCMSWCEAASCVDGLRNGGETDLDCGGACNVSCGAGQSCASDGDCASGMCRGARCVARRLAAGRLHTCALLEGGGVRCWGAGWYGQLGYGDRNAIGDEEVPSSVGTVDVGGPVVQLAAGGEHTCALLEDGEARCWGDNWNGQLGYARPDEIGDDELPSSVGVIDVGGRVMQLAAGDWHTCALLEGGDVRCWGDNEYGQLGYARAGAIGDDEVPGSVDVVDVGGRVVQLAAGRYHTCALLEIGAVRCWGDNEYGQLGYAHTYAIGGDEAPSSAGDVNVGGRVVQLAAGRSHTCALLEDGAVRCWGDNRSGQLGQGHTSLVGDDELPSSAGDVHVGGRAVQLAAGDKHTCALLHDGALRCWGFNDDGQLGQGDQNAIGDNELPDSVDVVDMGGRAVEIATGGWHTCALLDDGTLRCWGSNYSGQLGYGHTSDIGHTEVPSSVAPVSYR
jgi:cysteine-rich repeat protein